VKHSLKGEPLTAGPPVHMVENVESSFPPYTQEVPAIPGLVMLYVRYCPQNMSIMPWTLSTILKIRAGFYTGRLVGPSTLSLFVCCPSLRLQPLCRGTPNQGRTFGPSLLL